MAQTLPLAAQVLIGWLLYGSGDYWKHRAYLVEGRRDFAEDG